MATFLSFLLLIPITFYFESFSSMQSAYSAIANQPSFLINLFLCGMSYYLYNEMQNVVLGSLGPVPTGNSLTSLLLTLYVSDYLMSQLLETH